MSDGDGSTGSTGRGGRDWSAYGFLALMVLIGSSTAPAAKFAVRELPTGLIPLVRFGLAGLCLWPVVMRGGVLGRMLRNEPWRVLLTAAFCIPINQAFFLNGAKLAPTSHVSLIYATCPLVVLALAATLGQERFNTDRFAGVALSVFGVGLIALENLWNSHKTGADVLRGDLLLIGAVTSWGAYLTVGKPLINRYGSIPVLAATFLVGSALDVPIALATMPGWSPLTGVSRAAWLGLGHLTLVVTLFGLMFQNLALKRLDASQVATFGNVAPLLAIFWGHLLFGERITSLATVGGLMILGGVLWTSRPPRRMIAAQPIVQAPASS